MLFRDLLSWYARLWPRTPSRAPYNHIVQLGDPILRKPAKAIAPEFIKSHEVQQYLKQMQTVLQRYGAVGIAAPQIGIGSRVFMLEFNKKHRSVITDRDFEERQMDFLPLTTFINPEMKVLSHKQITFDEGCESIKGFAAKVARYEKVQIQAYNGEGKAFSLVLSGWLARIAQHEMDHLNGKVFTDIMLKETLECTCWQEVNKYQGKIILPYAP